MSSVRLLVRSVQDVKTLCGSLCTMWSTRQLDSFAVRGGAGSWLHVQRFEVVVYDVLL